MLLDILYQKDFLKGFHSGAVNTVSATPVHLQTEQVLSSFYQSQGALQQESYLLAGVREI